MENTPPMIPQWDGSFDNTLTGVKDVDYPLTAKLMHGPLRPFSYSGKNSTEGRDLSLFGYSL
jgi:hypothetical protein